MVKNHPSGGHVIICCVLLKETQCGWNVDHGLLTGNPWLSPLRTSGPGEKRSLSYGGESS